MSDTVLEPAWKVLATKAWRRVQLDDVRRRPTATQEEFLAALREAQRAMRAVKKMNAEEGRL